MASSELEKLEELFANALALEPGDARTRYLSGACGSDTQLREQVEELIAAHESASYFLEVPATDPNATVATPDRHDPREIERQIGHYRILQEIGEGGFGVVYMAEQERPVRRQVALKVIKLGMDTRRVIARFEAERQALAMMDHPNIARVLDAGATESGRPFFVMELVRGVPITEYCEKSRLSLRARLDLFLQVCHAVQHAHQKGIIHRDIKPSNVLVTLHDHEPVPKVIDFGIAKATTQRLTDKTLFTEFRQFIGTPEYMSPDQADSGLDVDTRTDVYSLGVLLYELLTRSTPFEPDTLRRAGLEELRRLLREVDPPRPSARIAAATEEHKVPRVEFDRLGLSRRLRGDLDWIVMKALEKDRTRRYQAASELAEDLQRHLEHKPVSAGPPSFRYRASKFIRRNRAMVAGASLVAMAVIVGLGLSIGGYVEATRAQRALKLERDAANEARMTAEAARAAERQHRRSAEATNAFLRDMLRSVDPSRARGREVTMRYVLDEAARNLAAGVLGEQPLVEADMRVTLGQSYEALGLYEAAEQQLRAAIERYADVGRPEPVDALLARSALAGVLNRMLLYEQAEALLERVLDPLRRLRGADHADTLLARSQLAIAIAGQGRLDEAERIHRETLDARRRTLGAEHRHTLLSRVHLATVFHLQGRYAEAEAELVDTLAAARRVLGEQHPDVTQTMNQLAVTYEAQRRYADAEALYEESWQLAEHVLGADHPNTQIVLNALLRVLRYQGKQEETRPLMEVRLAHLKRDADRPDAPAVALHTYALELLTCEPADLRDPAGALAAARRCVERDGGRDANYLETLALAYQANGDLSQAIETQRQAVEVARGGGPYNPAQMQRKLVDLLIEDGRFLEAASLGVGGVAAQLGRTVAEDFGSVGGSLLSQAEDSIARGNYGDAEQMLRAALALRQKELAPGHWAIAETESRIGEVLVLQQRLGEAEPFLRGAVEAMSNNPQTPRAVLADAQERLRAWERRLALPVP